MSNSSPSRGKGKERRTKGTTKSKSRLKQASKGNPSSFLKPKAPEPELEINVEELLRSEIHNVSKPSKWETPCSFFYQKWIGGAMDFHTFVQLQQGEPEAIVRVKAAQKIQAAWRGFITRYRMKILHLSAIKIQNFARGIQAKKRTAMLAKLMEDARIFEQRRKAAIKIQAAWRGHSSRTNFFDFAFYKAVQEKNRALSKSIEAVNKLEGVMKLDKRGALGGSGDVHAVSFESSSDLSEIVDQMPKDRLEELLKHAHNLVKDLAEKYALPFTKKRLAALDQLVEKDKVKAVKETIHLVRLHQELEERRQLQRSHHLIRTKSLPGVYSDISCQELTPAEQELKSIKFWTPSPDPKERNSRANKFSLSIVKSCALPVHNLESTRRVLK